LGSPPCGHVLDGPFEPRYRARVIADRFADDAHPDQALDGGHQTQFEIERLARLGARSHGGSKDGAILWNVALDCVVEDRYEAVGQIADPPNLIGPGGGKAWKIDAPGTQARDPFRHPQERFSHRGILVPEAGGRKSICPHAHGRRNPAMRCGLHHAEATARAIANSPAATKTTPVDRAPR